MLIFCVSIIVSINSVLIVKLKEIILDNIVKGLFSWKFLFFILVGVLIFAILQQVRNIFTENYIMRIRKSVIQKLLCNTSRLSELEKGSINYDALISVDLEFLMDNYYKKMASLLAIILRALFCYVYCFLISVTIGIYGIVMMILAYFLNKYIGRAMMGFQQSYLDRLNEYLKKIENFLVNMKTIKLYFIEGYIKDEYISEETVFIDSINKRFDFMAMANMINAVFYAIQKIGIIALGGILFYQNRITIGQLAATVSLASLLSSPIITVSQSVMAIKSTKQVREKFERLLRTDRFEYVFSDEFTSLELNVEEYSVGGEVILSDIDLVILPGKKYLVVGASGSGKSTLVKAITKTIDFKGQYSLNKLPLKDFQHPALFSLVTQNSKHFSATVAENMTLFSKDINKVKIDECIKITALPFNLTDQIVGQGTNISGGEAQRLAIARALYFDRDILIFDEALANINKSLGVQIEKHALLDKNAFINVSHYINKELLHLYDYILKVEDGSIRTVGVDHFKEYAYDQII